MRFFILILLFLGGSVSTANEQFKLGKEILEKSKVDKYQAIDWIQSLGNALKVCEHYDQAIRDLYWLEKSARSVTFFGHAGITFCLNQAEQFKKSDPKLSDELLAHAKTIAYNLASNSWPGWGDEGVAIDRRDIEIGLEAAKLNLRLAVELDKPKDKVANAQWLLSAMHLALSNYMDALDSVGKSIELYQDTSEKVATIYVEGFKGLIHMASGKGEEGSKLLKTALEKLNTLNTEESKFYVSQLKIARTIFVNCDGE